MALVWRIGPLCIRTISSSKIIVHKEELGRAVKWEGLKLASEHFRHRRRTSSLINGHLNKIKLVRKVLAGALYSRNTIVLARLILPTLR